MGNPSAWLAAIVASAQDAIVGKTLDGEVVSWNPAAEVLFGYRAEEMIGRPISLLADPAHPDEMTDILVRLRGGERIGRYEFELEGARTARSCPSRSPYRRCAAMRAS